MVFPATSRCFKLFITFSFLVLPFSAKAELECFQLLRKKIEIARDFEDHFLPKIKGLDLSQELQVDHRLLEEIVESVKKSVFLRVTSQVRDSAFYFNPKGQESYAEHAVRVAYSKNQYFNFDRETFVRFFPENLGLGQVLGALQRAIANGNFSPREVVYSRRDGASPEMIADTHLEFHDHIVSLRFAIVIPYRDPGQPLVTLLAPLVTAKTHGKMTTVFLNPHNREDHLVVSKWEHGRPVEGSLVKGSETLNVLRESLPFDEIVADPKNESLIEYFDEQLNSQRRFNDRSFQRVFEGWFKDGLVRLMAESREFELFNFVRNQLAPFPYYGYKKQKTYEHAAVQRALPILLKPEFAKGSDLNFFPPFLKRESILKALKENILSHDFVIGEQAKGHSYSARIFTRLRIESEVYSVEAILSIPKDKKSRLGLISLRPLVDSTVSNQMVSVFYDPVVEKYIVVTRWFDGDPMEGLVIDR
jgi:hypothetical protein